MGVNLPPPPPQVSAKSLRPIQFIENQHGSKEAAPNSGQIALDTEGKEARPRKSLLGGKPAGVRIIYADDSAANAAFKYMVWPQT